MYIHKYIYAEYTLNHVYMCVFMPDIPLFRHSSSLPS